METLLGELDAVENLIIRCDRCSSLVGSAPPVKNKRRPVATGSGSPRSGELVGLEAECLDAFIELTQRAQREGCGEAKTRHSEIAWCPAGSVFQPNGSSLVTPLHPTRRTVSFVWTQDNLRRFDPPGASKIFDETHSAVRCLSRTGCKSPGGGRDK